MAVILNIHTKTASKLNFIDIIHCFLKHLCLPPLYEHITTPIGTIPPLQVQRSSHKNMYFFVKLMCFMLKMVVIAKIKHIPIVIC